MDWARAEIPGVGSAHLPMMIAAAGAALQCDYCGRRRAPGWQDGWYEERFYSTCYRACAVWRSGCGWPLKHEACCDQRMMAIEFDCTSDAS